MAGERKSVISVDAMGSDSGPSTIVKGINKALRKHRKVKILLHGPEDQLRPLVDNYTLTQKNIEICDAPDVIQMGDKPAAALRKRKGTSMFSTLEAVRDKRATTAVSCGNTGALMAISTITLKRMEGVKRPAIAVFWPSLNPQQYNVVLDVGADIKADADDLWVHAHLGSAYASNAFKLDRPRVGLLNVGTEDHKGTGPVKEASELFGAHKDTLSFEYIGFVEGDGISSDSVDVVVTDGFAGNIALKTAEGTAKVIGEILRGAFKYSLLSRFASVFAITSLWRLKRRIDPRYANGGVFLGLNGTVVKSHGGADSTGIAAALDLAIRLDQNGFSQKVAGQLSEPRQKQR